MIPPVLEEHTPTINPPRTPVHIQNVADEINLLEYAYAVLKKKWLLIGLLIIGGIMGYVLALVQGPEYTAEAVITPRESDAPKMPNMGALGMLGGFVATQLNMSGNASLDKIDLVLGSRNFTAELIEHKNLLPLLLPEQWDSASKSWKAGFVPPDYPKVAGLLSTKLLKKEINNKNNTMTLRITSGDSLVSHAVLSAYLEYLDAFIRSSVQQDAKENRDYLEEQLISVIDPLLRAKIQELIASEVEKMMVVSKEAFIVIDPVFTTKDFKKKKLLPIILGIGLSFCGMIILIFAYAFSTAPKTSDDSVLLLQVRRELLRLPFQRLRKSR
jgi:hypothetical protein